MQAQCLGLDRSGRQAREVGCLVIDRMDDSNPRGSILPCTHREAHRQSAIAHLALFIRSLERLHASSGCHERDKLEELIREAESLRDRIETL